MVKKYNLIKNKNIIFIDVRSKEEFDALHIPGAQHIPLDQLENSLSELDKSNYYITICGKGGGRSEKGAEILREAGFDAQYLEGGTFGWFEKKD